VIIRLDSTEGEQKQKCVYKLLCTMGKQMEECDETFENTDVEQMEEYFDKASVY